MYYEEAWQRYLEGQERGYQKDQSETDLHNYWAWESRWGRMGFSIECKMFCFVSLWLDLPTVWHGLGRWAFGGIEQITFSLYINVCSVNFVIFWFWGVGVSHCGPFLGTPHRLAGAQYFPCRHSQAFTSPTTRTLASSWTPDFICYQNAMIQHLLLHLQPFGCPHGQQMPHVYLVSM